MLRVDPVGTLTLVRFERIDGVSSLLHRARHEPADGVTLPGNNAVSTAPIARRICIMGRPSECAAIRPERGGRFPQRRLERTSATTEPSAVNAPRKPTQLVATDLSLPNSSSFGSAVEKGRPLVS
jgi:hypothetical protein